MEEDTRNYFKILETVQTETGKIHHIAWNYYFPKNFLHELSKQAIALGWLQSGLYSLKHGKSKTDVFVHDRILKDLEEILKYIANS